MQWVPHAGCNWKTKLIDTMYMTVKKVKAWSNYYWCCDKVAIELLHCCYSTEPKLPELAKPYERY
jgi:hypothetical protein